MCVTELQYILRTLVLQYPVCTRIPVYSKTVLVVSTVLALVIFMCSTRTSTSKSALQQNKIYTSTCTGDTGAQVIRYLYDTCTSTVLYSI